MAMIIIFTSYLFPGFSTLQAQDKSARDPGIRQNTSSSGRKANTL